MKLGISALLFNLEEALNLCEKNPSITHIELGIDNIYQCDELDKYKERINDLNLSLSIHLPMELNSCENIKYISDSWIDFFMNIKQKLNNFDIKYYNLHLGYVITNRLYKNRNKYLDNSVKFLDKISYEKDINISIENVYSNLGDFSNVGNKAYDFEYIFNKIENENIWFCYDTGHNLINNDDYINKLKSKTKVIHLSDNDGIKDIHIGIGKGILSLNHIKEVIKLNPKYMILEIDFKHIEDTINILDTIKKEV